MTQSVICPGCSKQIVLDDSPQAQENNVLRQQIEELKKIPKMQSFVPGSRCSNGDCDQVHPNPNYTKIPKGKCRNCDQFSSKKEGKCAWCKQDELEEIDKDELTDLGIELPE